MKTCHNCAHLQACPCPDACQLDDELKRVPGAFDFIAAVIGAARDLGIAILIAGGLFVLGLGVAQLLS